MDYLDKDKLKAFDEAMKDRNAARAKTRDKVMESPAELRARLKAEREKQDKPKSSPWQGM